MDLTTNYLGLTLKNPLVPSSSPLSGNLDSARRLEDAGASALVMYSLFEEQIKNEEIRLNQLDHQQLVHAEADHFLPTHHEFSSEVDTYLEQLQRLKQNLEIPVVASLNGTTPSGWLTYGRALEEAGADALELNVYYIPTNPLESGIDVEQRYLDILAELRASIAIPIAMKLTSQFSNLGNFVTRLEQAGVNGVSLFNRLYQPDIDIDSLRVATTVHLSHARESHLALRWIAILRDYVKLTLAATGGVHDSNTAIKLLLAGADVVHLCSILLMEGPSALARILRGIENWLEESAFDSLEQIRGLMSHHQSDDPQAFVRSNYINMLAAYPVHRNW